MPVVSILTLLLAACGSSVLDADPFGDCRGDGWSERGDAPGWQSWSDISVIAHRGHVCCDAENTLEGIERAVSYGMPAVEIDVRHTADGVPVLMHDESLDRTTDRTGELRSTTLEELSHANACPDRGFCAVATLEEALAAVRGRAFAVLDLKDTRSCSDFEPIVRAVEEQDMASAVAFISDNFNVLLVARASFPTVPVGLYIWSDSALPRDSAEAVEAMMVVGGAELVVRREAVLAQRSLFVGAVEHGIPVIAWPASTGRQIDSLLVVPGVVRVLSDVLPH